RGRGPRARCCARGAPPGRCRARGPRLSPAAIPPSRGGEQVAEHASPPTPTADPREHPAVRAWAGLHPGPVEATGVEKLQKKGKGQVYRLAGVGPGGTAVIAKRSSPERIRGERTVYETVLPDLRVPTVRYLGAVEEPGGTGAWLFLEDAGAEAYSPLCEGHRILAGRWLGLLHTSAARLAAAARLPDRGPGYYLGHLRSARATILGNLTNPALSAADVAVLEAVVRQGDTAAAHWGQGEKLCARTPRTLVHR